MEQKIRRLDDPSNTSGTLLTLPQSDFPRPKKSPSNLHGIETRASDANDNDEDRLMLVRLPSSAGCLTLNDLTQGQTVYILGDTSEHDINHYSSEANGQAAMDDDGPSREGNIHVPVAARLIVEGTSDESNANFKGKTLELMRVETSNTYILVPPMPIHKKADEASNEENGSKRQKLEGGTKKLTTMPARSVGLIPGEESPACFFLEPIHLKPGHYAHKLRWALSHWVYDPFDLPEGKFGYTLTELGHICRTSESEVGYALWNRVYGADDALVLPVGEESENDGRRYGILSEEGRQTVSMAILSALLESNIDLSWHFSEENKSTNGMDLSLLLKDVRTHWHNLEEDGVIDFRRESQEDHPILTDSKHQSQGSESQSQFFTPAQFTKMRSSQNDSHQLSNEVIWHCLRPMVCYAGNDHKDNMPSHIWLLPDKVAKLAAHNVFLRANTSDGWEESEFMEAWDTRMPSISKYEPTVDLLRGIALKEVIANPEDGGVKKVWQYFPEAGLSLAPSLRIKSMFAMRSSWTLEEAVPYLEKFLCHGVNGENDKSVDVDSGVKSVLEKYAKAGNTMETNESGQDVIAVKYMLLK
jgi:hypothetical protein